MEKDHLPIKKVVKNLTMGTGQFVSCSSPYVQVNSLNYSPFSSL